MTHPGEQLYQWLLAQEITDDNDRRFYASYLLGHASLVLADTEQQPEQFDSLLEHNLQQALQQDQLSAADKLGINGLLTEARQR